MARTIELEYPNREKAASRIMRLVVVATLVASTALMASVTVRGWDLMQSARTYNVVFIALNAVFIVQALRWSRGALPMAAGVAAFVAIFSGLSIGSWYDRDAFGYAEAALSSELGMLTTVVFGLQFLVVAVTIGAFTQNWQEEVERVVGADVRPEHRPADPVAA